MQLYEDIMITQCGQRSVRDFGQAVDAVLALQDPGVCCGRGHCVAPCIYILE